jgi:hypothetical protein
MRSYPLKSCKSILGIKQNIPTIWYQEKLQTYRGQFENLKMKEEENIAEYLPSSEHWEKI